MMTISGIYDSKPIILLTCPVEENGAISLAKDYTDAIYAAGGIPVALPYTTDDEALLSYVLMADGYLFTGGADIDPAIYGEEKSAECGKIQVQRDDVELRLFSLAYDTGKPIMGICRGSQVINVALGGTLYQDIPTECPSKIGHSQSEDKHEYSHGVRVLRDTPLYELSGGDWMGANSFHHQAVKRLGRGLEVMAVAEDGVVEALYSTEHPYMRLYQWHPERLYTRDESNRRIFLDFIEAVKNGKKALQ